MGCANSVHSRIAGNCLLGECQPVGMQLSSGPARSMRGDDQCGLFTPQTGK